MKISDSDADFHEMLCMMLARSNQAKIPPKETGVVFFAIEEEISLQRKIVVCHAEQPRKTSRGVEKLPVHKFLKHLWDGKIF
jgi:hypothetical protein